MFSQHLLALLNDILDISRMDAGKFALAEDNLDILKLLEDVVAVITPRCAAKQLHLDAHIGKIAPPAYRCDGLRVRQTLINLLGNAVKFTPTPGTVGLRVVQLAYKDGRSLIRFVVSDTGIGIPQKVLDTLFDPFEQARAGLTKEYGTLLGLSVSHRVIALMGGTIDVQSEEGKGSTFSFAVWLQETQTPALPAATPAISPVGKRALLVDAVPLTRMISLETLAGAGMQIDEAEDGQEAVEKFAVSEPGHYDVIFMDVQTPKLDGYEATRAIRALQRSDARTVPVIAMTDVFHEDDETVLAAGMNAYLTKPLDLDRLNALLAKHLGGGD
jgi:CheY-like chemotaxis protein